MLMVLFLIAIAWFIYPFIGIPVQIGTSSENKMLKRRIKELEDELALLKQNGEKTVLQDDNTAETGTLQDDVFSPEERSAFAAGINDEVLNADKNERVSSLPVGYSVSDGNNEPLVYSKSMFENNGDQNSAGNVTETETIGNVTETIENAEETETADAETRKQKNVSGILITGVSMVLLAGLIFVTTNWNSIGSGFKIFLSVLVTLIFFGASFLAEKKLGIESTSRGFFVLGVFFVPITSVSVFFYKIFGEWLSFSGEGKMLALMAVFLSCAGACVLITGKFRNHISAFGAMLFVSAAVCSLGFFTESYIAFYIIAAMYSCAVIYINQKTLARLEIPVVYSEVFGKFSVFNVFAMASVALVFGYADSSSAETAAAVIMFITATLYFQLKTDNKEIFLVCSLVSVVEFIYLALIVSDIMMPDTAIRAEEKNIIFVLCLVPAFAVYNFVPKLKSEISALVLNILMFSGLLLNLSFSEPVSFTAAFLMTAVSCALSRRKYLLFTYSVLLVPYLYFVLLAFDLTTDTALPAVSYTVCAVFTACRFLSSKSERFDPAALVFAGWSVLCPVLTAVIYISNMSAVITFAVSVTVFLAAQLLENRSGSGESFRSVIFSIISASEYIIMDYLIVQRFTPDITSGFSLAFTLTAVPALVLYTYVKPFRSKTAQCIVTGSMFLWSVLHFTTNHPAACAVVSAAVILTALNEKRTAVYTVSAVMVTTLVYQFTVTLGSGRAVSAVIVSVFAALMFFISEYFSDRYEKIRGAGTVFMICTMIFPVVSRFPDKPFMCFTLLLSTAVLGLAAYRRELKDSSKSSILLALASSAHFQIFAFLLSDNILFGRFSSEAFTENVPMYIASLVTMGIVAAAGFAVRRSSVFVSKSFVFSSPVMVLMTFIIYTPSPEGKWGAVAGCALIIYFILCGMISNEKEAQVLYTAAAVSAVPTLLFQKFFPVSDLLMPEYCVLCTLVPYIFLFRIWREKRDELWNVLFAHSCIAMASLGIAAVSSSELFHVIIMGVTCAVLIMITLITGSKRWSRLGTVTLVVLVFYATKDFWSSLAWWAYLLLTGILLIIYAAVNEYCRQTGRENVIRESFKALFEALRDKKN